MEVMKPAVFKDETTKNEPVPKKTKLKPTIKSDSKKTKAGKKKGIVKKLLKK